MANNSESASTDELFVLSELDATVAPRSKKRRGTQEIAVEDMPGIHPAILADHAVMTGWRRAFHADPEVGFDEHRTSARVAELLASWGIEVTRGKFGGATGVVGTLEGKTPSALRIGLRADMDGLPMTEMSDPEKVPHRSTNGAIHACGHDGHMTMLLGAAKYLAATRDFSGTVTFFFQPNEEGVVNGTMYPEGASGGELMVKQGLFKAHPCDQIYGIHNWPELPSGQLGVKTGALMVGPRRSKCEPTPGRPAHACDLRPAAATRRAGCRRGRRTTLSSRSGAKTGTARCPTCASTRSSRAATSSLRCSRSSRAPPSPSTRSSSPSRSSTRAAPSTSRQRRPSSGAPFVALTRTRAARCKSGFERSPRW